MSPRGRFRMSLDSLGDRCAKACGYYKRPNDGPDIANVPWKIAVWHSYPLASLAKIEGYHSGMPDRPRRFPPPWDIEEHISSSGTTTGKRRHTSTSNQSQAGGLRLGCSPATKRAGSLRTSPSCRSFFDAAAVLIAAIHR